MEKIMSTPFEYHALQVDAGAALGITGTSGFSWLLTAQFFLVPAYHQF